MKNLLALLVACALVDACTKPSPPVDKESTQKAVSELYEAYASATKAKNAVAVAGYLADDGLFLGTDPDEFWSKQRVVEEFGNMAKDPGISWDFEVNKREIRVSQDGTMAIVAEQYFIPVISKKISIRGVSHARIIDGQWKIDFYSWALVPSNEDLVRMNMALEQ